MAEGLCVDMGIGDGVGTGTFLICGVGDGVVFACVGIGVW